MPLHLASNLAAFLLPPLCLLLLGGTGFLLLNRYPRAAKTLLGTMLVVLWGISMPPVGDWLLLQLDLESELAAPSRAADIHRARAIVVLSAGRYHDSAEYQSDTVDAFSLERVRRAAMLYRQTGLPLLVTGGRPEHNDRSLAGLLKVAADEFAVPIKWMEEQATTTHENAQFTRRILAAERIDTIVLVTHGWHMPRARRAFERAGFTVVPAATGLHHRQQTAVRNFLPTAGGLRNSEIFFHEIIGLIWYEIIQAGTSK